MWLVLVFYQKIAKGGEANHLENSTNKFFFNSHSCYNKPSIICDLSLGLIALMV